MLGLYTIMHYPDHSASQQVSKRTQKFYFYLYLFQTAVIAESCRDDGDIHDRYSTPTTSFFDRADTLAIQPIYPPLTLPGPRAKPRSYTEPEPPLPGLRIGLPFTPFFMFLSNPCNAAARSVWRTSTRPARRRST